MLMKQLDLMNHFFCLVVGNRLDGVFFETDDSGIKIGSIYQAASLLLQLPEARLAEQVLVNWNAISKRKIT